MDWFRSVVGVAVGFGVFVIGSLVPRGAAMEQPPGTTAVGFAAGAIGYGVVFAALAGLTAASIAGRRYLTHAARYAATPATFRRLPPRAGEHTDEVLREAGYSDAEVCRLREAGVAG